MCALHKYYTPVYLHVRCVALKATMDKQIKEIHFLNINQN